MQKTIIAAVAVLFSAGAAYAADLGGSTKDMPIVNAVPNWAGLYVGGTVGFGVADTTQKYLDAGTEDNFDMNGAIYGIHLGYNFQRGSMVYGLEAAFNGTNLSGDKSANYTSIYNNNEWTEGTYTIKRKIDWYSTLTGRLGYAQGSTLFYGLGGLAWAKVKTTETNDYTDYTQSDNTVTGVTGSWSDKANKTELGWTAGVGIEHAFNDRFSARIEYAHIDLGGHKIFEGAEKSELSFDTIKIGASLKLTGDREALK